MIRNILTLLLCIIIGSPILCAENKEENVLLDRRDNKKVTKTIDYALVTFEFVTAYDNKARVKVTIENSSPTHTLFIFKNTKDENMLKKMDPTKVEFGKTYGGDKGRRFVKGCRNLDSDVMLLPATTQELFTIDASVLYDTELEIPFYVASYQAKGFLKSAKYNILLEEVKRFILEIKDWSELDPTYVDLQNAVINFKHSIEDVKFCKNTAHRPTLEEQMRPFKATQDSIIEEIDKIFNSNRQWQSVDEPHIAYTKMRSDIADIDLEKLTYDCGKHVKAHSCGYCSFSAEQIYHRLDDIYQQLHTGRINKGEALKTARALNNCYKQNTRRKRDSFYGGKITEYYSRIANF